MPLPILQTNTESDGLMDTFQAQLQQLHAKGNNPFWKYLTSEKGLNDIRTALENGLDEVFEDTITIDPGWRGDPQCYEDITVEGHIWLEDVVFLPVLFDGEYEQELPIVGRPEIGPANAFVICTSLEYSNEGNYIPLHEFTTLLHLDDDDIVQMDTIDDFRDGPFNVRPMKENISAIVDSIKAYS